MQKAKKTLDPRSLISGPRFFALLAVIAVVFLLPLVPLEADDAGVEPLDRADALPERYRQWLEDVELLITPLERETFAQLTESYQRDHFIRRFWKARDPFPQTGVNELRQKWEVRVQSARQTLGTLEGDAARMLLYLGEPAKRERLTCSDYMETIEVWYYPEGNDRIGGYFTLVFTNIRRDMKDYRLWDPGFGLRGLVSTTRISAANPRLPIGDDTQLANLIINECIRGDDIIGAMIEALDVVAVEKVVLPRVPNDEWVQTFKARSTDMPEGVELLAGTLSLDYPGRNQSRTVVQGVVAIPRDAATMAADAAIYNLLLDGEILRKGKLFDNFRYRFDFQAETTTDTLPIVVQRYLRPGDYQLIVKVEDLHSKRVFRKDLQIQVPVYDPVSSPLNPPEETAVASSPDATEGEAPSAAPPPTAFTRRLGEANDQISTGDHAIEILDMSEMLLVGKVRVSARTRGEGIARVAFELNGVTQMRKTRPPYSVELDLGNKPRLHTLRAIALDVDNKRLAFDQVQINAGPHRFAIRFIEPVAGKLYTESVRVHTDVEVPEGDRLDRVELYLNEELITTLYQPPYEHPLFLDGSKEITFLSAKAYLADGNKAEAAVFINAPDFVDAYDVIFQELYTTVVDKKGDFVEDLREEEVTVFEDEIEQEIRRFERVRDLPISAGLVIDTSTSMTTMLRDVQRAAHRFLETVLTERDRAAVMTFNDAPSLVVRFTSDTEILAGGLAGLVAEGETALYDSVIFALHYLSGGSGKRAIILLTDGEDSISQYSFEDAIEFARHTGVAIYIIGLGLPSDPTARSQVRQLASETGGETFFIDGVGHLNRVYEDIQQELRSQYLIGYQSSQTTKPNDQFREVEVTIDRKGLEAKTIRGYYP